jgi:cardiolipin synthase
MRQPSKKMIVLTILLTAAATLLVSLLVRNLSSGEAKIQHEIEHHFGVSDEQFQRAVGHLLGPPIVDGNRVTALHNGDQIFPAMLEAIRGARRSITFETYIYWSGTIAEEFSAALSERARAGVPVHVLLDWLGSSKMDQQLIDQMKEAGVKVDQYHPLRWYSLDRVNNRTHRKLLVIDGRIGFTGGVGIADEWRGSGDKPDEWRDSHYRVEGPAVADMQSAFMDNWLKTRSRVLYDQVYFPSLEPVGTVNAQMFKSSPREGSESVRLLYLLAIASAERSLYIGNPYFVPDDLALQALVDARQRGVHIEIITVGPVTDTQLTRRASRARWGKLLEAGVEIYEFQPTLYHNKLMIVDSCMVSVGSTNFDNRSFRLNDEANLNVFDTAFAEEQEKAFAHDRARSRQITLEQWKNRPWKEKLAEHAASLLRSQL